MGFSRQEKWSGLSFPSPGDFPTQGSNPHLPALQADSLPTDLRGKPRDYLIVLGVSRPKSRCRQGYVPIWRLQGKCIFLSFPAPGGACVPWLLVRSSIFKSSSSRLSCSHIPRLLPWFSSSCFSPTKESCDYTGLTWTTQHTPALLNLLISNWNSPLLCGLIFTGSQH